MCSNITPVLSGCNAHYNAPPLSINSKKLIEDLEQLVGNTLREYPLPNDTVVHLEGFDTFINREGQRPIVTATCTVIKQTFKVAHCYTRINGVFVLSRSESFINGKMMGVVDFKTD